MEDVAEDICVENCDDCDAANAGGPFDRIYGNTANNRLGYAYQHRVIEAHGVASFFPHLPQSRIIREWELGGVRFDGLVAPACLLLEAKAGHDSWFQEDFSPGGRPRARDSFVSRVLLPKITAEAVRQANVVRPNHPRVRLKWVFSAHVFKIWFTEFTLGVGDLSVIIDIEWMA